MTPQKAAQILALDPLKDDVVLKELFEAIEVILVEHIKLRSIAARLAQYHESCCQQENVTWAAEHFVKRCEEILIMPR